MSSQVAAAVMGLGVLLYACGKPSKVSSTRDASTPASDARVDAGRAPICTRSNPLKDVFFGDLHVHTALSLDANLQGTRMRPSDAYRFARGEAIELPPYDSAGHAQRTHQLERALDFVAVTDHAEFLGLVTTCTTKGLEGYDSAECQSYRDDPVSSFVTINLGLAAQPADVSYAAPCTSANHDCGAAQLAAWNETRDAAAHAHDASPACRFTSFVGYEWSASPGTQNLHRNVIFANEQVPPLPFSYFDGSHETDLWSALDSDCLQAKTGCDVLTIPHNSNLSAGLMFETRMPDGKPFSASYAKRRAAMEPLVEIFQHKGSSECLPEMGADEACNFELMPYNTLGTVTIGGSNQILNSHDYLRDALGVGLKLGQRLGVNPFRYGFVAATDTHLAIAGGVDEQTFPGHGGAGNPARDAIPEGLIDHAWLNPGGLTALWAEENSRPALFAAMQRREAYGTSGPRMTLRFFGGFDVPKTLCDASTFVQTGYAHGVPMGGELTSANATNAPRFAAWAMQDPGTDARPGHGLSRLQIVKGWLESGVVKYAVVDMLPPVDAEAEVDLTTCESTGRGKPELCSVWSDPDFDPKQPAFYYARVLEVPSCRWHAYACAAARVDCADPTTVSAGLAPCCDGRSATIRERAWSSPIFYAAD